jgi:hypothetical protein
MSLTSYPLLRPALKSAATTRQNFPRNESQNCSPAYRQSTRSIASGHYMAAT